MRLDRGPVTFSWGEGPRPLPRVHFPLDRLPPPKNPFLGRTLQLVHEIKRHYTWILIKEEYLNSLMYIIRAVDSRATRHF